ncbi:MAG: hypothetical protein ACP5N2_03785 [Candidatus Nanoarchaeia archaeon]
MEDTKNTGMDVSALKELKTYKRNIKVDLPVWNALNNLKGKNETFNEVIQGLLQQKTKTLGGENIQLTKYHRKVLFIKTDYQHRYTKPLSDINKNISIELPKSANESIGIEFEYNDIKSNSADFTLDIRMKKVFFKKQILNPSEFFGLDYAHKHLYHAYLNLYLRCVALVLEKEFRASHRMFSNKDFEDIASWRKLYYDYSLSEESFITDIQEPLRLSEQDPSRNKYLKDIEKSIAFSIWR